MASLIATFEEKVKQHPDRVLYADRYKGYTYAQTEDAARCIATEILKKIGASRKPVGVYLDKSAESLLLFWGVLFSGNFYCPLDAGMPDERVTKIRDTLRAELILSDREYEERAKTLFPEAEILLFEDLIQTEEVKESVEAAITSRADEDPVYVLFTSGSTGVPKGVLLPERVVTNYGEWLTKTFAFGEEPVFGNQAPLFFDVSVHDIYGAVYTGGRAEIIPPEYFGFPVRLIQYLNEREVTTFLWVPSAMNILAAFRAFRAAKPEHLRQIMFAGEVLPRTTLDYWREHIPDAVYANLYGPTETFVCTAHIMRGDEDGDAPLPIGHPVSNTECLILGEAGRPVPDGEAGELCVGGTCLALGYYNAPELTEKSFVRKIGSAEYPETLYRTGDLVRKDEKGDLIYVTRKDFQFKHLGYRIEPGEIEAAAVRLPAVEDCACLYDQENKEIVLCYAGRSVPEEDLLEGLRARLPQYMVPERCIFLPALPKNVNGKTDRKALKDCLR